MYPILFENLYFEKVWGGRGLQQFRDNLPKGLIGESWDIACHENGVGIVANGKLKGIRFDELIKKFGHELVGTKVSTDTFPLLVKIINAKQDLSVQVHPDDKYAAEYEKESGKTEAWYVIDAEPGATLIVGTKNCDKEIFRKAIEQQKTEEYLNKINVKKGDCFLIDSGLVHAICSGIVLAEIQQNSDITYRVYDYGRPRELHVEKALGVIRFELEEKKLSSKELIQNKEYKKSLICKNKYFAMEKYEINETVKETSDLERFFILTVVEGSGEIKSQGFVQKVKIGDSVFIPAVLGEYEVSGELKMIKSYTI